MTGVSAVVALMKASRAGWSGSGTSIVATCGFPVRRSLRSDCFSSISTNAMFIRLTCGLIAQFSIVTSCDDACMLRRPGSPVGNTYERLVHDHGEAEAIVLRPP